MLIEQQFHLHLLWCPSLCLKDVVSHSKKLNKKSKNQVEEMVTGDKQGIKGLSKERRKKLEAYQHLFYLLQVSSFIEDLCEHFTMSPTSMLHFHYNNAM